jgi:ribosomal protein L16 Arg81 hydroxylase
MSAFATLIDPYNPQEFLATVWTKKSVLMQTDYPDRFNSLFSWDTLNYLLNFHELDASMRLAVGGKVLDKLENANFLERCQSGATLILDRVHKLVPALETFTTDLRAEIGHPVQVNVYCSWPANQGFSRHYDTHDVFILQLDGFKEWKVFGETFKYPLKADKSSKREPPDDPPLIHTILQPGDVLYIPRGHWHEALAVDRPSLHLTLGVHGKTGIDFLEWAIEQLKQEEIWRENLPLLLLGSPITVQSQIENLTDRLLESITSQNLGDRYIQDLGRSPKPVSRYALPQQVGFNVFPEGAKTGFRKPENLSIAITPLPEQEAYQIVAGNKQVTLKGVPYTFVDRLFHCRTFTGVEVMSWLPEYDWEMDIVPLLTRLVKEGLIYVDG